MVESGNKYKIFCHFAATSACVYHRILMPARFCQPFLANSGIELVCDDKLRENWGGCQALMVHGMPPPELPAKVARWHQSGRKYLSNQDDLYGAIPEWNPAKELFRPDQHGANYFLLRNAAAMCVTTQALADALPKKPNGDPYTPIFVCPNLIDPAAYQAYPEQRQNRRTLRILWQGSNTHLGDLEEIVESVSDILERYKQRVEFLFWGDIHPEIRRRHLFKGVVEIKHVPLADYFNILSERITPDICICPLADNPFNRCKSAIKALEGFAIGAAVIASPTEPYARVIEHNKNGMLVRTREEWNAALAELIEDPKKRSMLVDNGNVTLHTQYSWNNPRCVKPWVEFFKAVPDLKVN